MLFVSSTTGGGSGRSQRELVRRLIARGHDVEMLVDDKRPARLLRWFHEQAADANVRFEGLPARRARKWVESRPGRSPVALDIDGIRHRVTPIPENAFASVVDEFAPDIVVGNSLVRLTWRRIRAACTERGVPTLLYVREIATFGHFAAMADPADLLVANASSLAAAVRAAGHECSVIPSVVDTTPTSVDSSRTTVLLINPLPSHGLEQFWSIAERLPHRPFVLQESWPLAAADRAEIDRRLERHPNVTFRERLPPGPDLYRDARLLLVPHRIDNRPRVIAEAQANAIPAFVSDFPGLAEAVGDGGLVVQPDDIAAWCGQIERSWTDDSWYDDLCARARRHSRRPELDPELVVEQFEVAVRSAIVAARHG